MLIAVAVGTPLWWWAASGLRPDDGLPGWTLGGAGAVFAHSSAGAWAAGVVILAGVPAALAGAVLAATGNPLSGLACAAGSAALAFGGASGLGVARRAADAGRTEPYFPALMIETALWCVLLTLLSAAIDRGGRQLRGRLPDRLTSRSLGGGVRLLGFSVGALWAGLITAVLGGVLALGLLRSDDPGQILGGLFVAFTLASLIGFAIAPHDRPWPTLLAPGLVALVGYGWAAWQLRGRDEMLLAAWYQGTLPALALGLPVHYLTAGVLGCCLGTGVGQLLEHVKRSDAFTA